jgi:hypothetical protein
VCTRFTTRPFQRASSKVRLREGAKDGQGLIYADFLITSISIAQHAIGIIPNLIWELWPSLALLASFATFVVWNGGVVMGEHNGFHEKPLLTLFRR